MGRLQRILKDSLEPVQKKRNSESKGSTHYPRTQNLRPTGTSSPCRVLQPTLVDVPSGGPFHPHRKTTLSVDQ